MTLLGLDKLVDGVSANYFSGDSNSTVYTGTRQVDFATNNMLNVDLDEINTTNNFINGSGSHLLACIGLPCHSYGDINTVQFQHPEYKLLQKGVLYTLSITTKDSEKMF